MKIRLTPLNIISAALLVISVYSVIDHYYIIDHIREEGWGILLGGIFGALALITIITDLIFRRLISQLKRIWIIEFLFIIFVATLIILYNKI